MVKNINIHPTACVHPNAKLESGVVVGPYAIIGENVKIGEDTVISNGCVIDGKTRIGKRCRIFTGAVIGSEPQDLKYKGEKTQIIVGDDNTIREYVTINLATGEKGKTVIGNNNLLMAYSHVAHDCVVGNQAVIANVGTLAGHVSVEDRAIIGGMVAIHQFARVGKMSITGGCSKVTQDIPPFSIIDGHPAKVYGLNSIGLKRAEVPAESVKNLKSAFKILFKMKIATSSAFRRIKESIPDDPYVSYLLKFIRKSERGICKGS